MSTLMPDSISPPHFGGAPRPTWLWPLRIPYAKITLLAGDPGLGKSFLALDLAARLSKGLPMPHTPSPIENQKSKIENPGHTLLLSAEDELHDTIYPRLRAMNADLSLIHPLRCLDSHQQYPEPFSLKSDTGEITDAIEEHNAQLLILDPITAFMEGIDPNSTVSLRTHLAPLAHLAAFYGIAVLAITHLSKDQSRQSLYRTTGSLALAALARTVHLVHPSPTRTHNLLTPIKSNLASNLQPLPFRLTNNQIEWLPLPRLTPGESPAAADIHDSNPQSHFDNNDAIDFLRESLAAGPQPAIPLIRQAKQLAISERTLKRAKAQLGIISKKDGLHRWLWLLPHSPLAGHDQIAQ